MALENLVKSDTQQIGFFRREFTYYALTLPFTAKQMWRKVKTAFNRSSIHAAAKASLALPFIAPQAVIATTPTEHSTPATQLYRLDTVPAAQLYQLGPQEEKNTPNLDLKLKPYIRETNSSKPINHYFNITSKTTISKKEVHRWMGSLSLVGGYATEDFSIEKYEGVPGILISSIGYNIFDRDRKEGTLLFPNLRVIGQLNKSKYPWGNLLEVCPGFYAQKLPFGIGAEFVHREPLKPGAGDFVQRTSYLGQESEDFFRAYFHGWSDWYGKPMSDSLESPMQFWGTQYFEFRYDTSSFDNLVFDARADLNLKLLRIGPSPQREYKLPGILKFDGVTFTPFAAGTFNYDYQNEPWNRFVQLSGGLKIIEGPYELFFEFGYRKSLNGPAYEGPVFNALFRLWLPLDFGKHISQR